MKSFLTTLTSISLFLSLASCGSESDGASGNANGGTDSGLPIEVTSVLSDEDIELLEDLGITVYRGDSPPNVEGLYIADSRTLVRSSFADPLDPGHEFFDANYRFSSQTENQIFAEVNEDGGGSSQGFGSFIAGQDQEFSIFAILEGQSDGIINRTINIFSGRLSAEGIQDFQQAGYLDSKEGDDDNMILIPEQTGRLIEESDGLVERL